MDTHLGGLSTGDYEVKMIGPGQAVLIHSRSGALKRIFTMLVFFAIYYAFLVATSAAGWVLALFLLFPILFVPWLIFYIRVAMRGLCFEFDSQSRTIRRNGHAVARFENLECLCIRRLHAQKLPDAYVLSAILRDKTNIRIVSHWDKERVRNTADALAKIVRVFVTGEA